MEYTHNAIYTYIESKVLEAYPNVYVSSVYEPVVPHFPVVFVRELSNQHNQANVTMSGVQGVRTSTYEVQVQSNDRTAPMSEAYAIFDVVTSAFVELYYILDNTNVLEDGSDGLFRLRASFRKVIGSADQMPSINGD